jgi:hypothetical protein
MTSKHAQDWQEISDQSRLSPAPLVSVIMLAYNHGPFIRQAIESVVSQKADFAFELIIAEDHSSDDTFRIAAEYQQKHPDRIRLLTSASNVGMQKNIVRAYAACRGEFMAYCEGDDFWCDTQKLQRQVDYLRTHREAVMVFHDAREIDTHGAPLGDSEIDRLAGAARKPVYTPADLARGAFVPLLSTLHRNKPDLLRSHFMDVKNADTYVFAILGQFGEAHEIEGAMATYRHHRGGTWSALAGEQQAFERSWSFRAICLDIEPVLARAAATALREHAVSALFIALRSRNAPAARRALSCYWTAVVAPLRQPDAESVSVSARALVYPFQRAWVRGRSRLGRSTAQRNRPSAQP